MAEVRTKSELNNPEAFNYYLAFKIDPKETNPEKIEEAIKKQKSTWTSGGPTARRYIALYQDIINVMVNDVAYDENKASYSISGARAKEFAVAKKFKIDTAVNGLALASGGLIYKSQLQTLVKNEKNKWFTEDELANALSALKGQGIKIVDDTQKLMDFVGYKSMRDLLKTLNKSTVYEFLEGCSPNSSPAELVASADIAYKNIKNRTSSEGTASQNLVGVAKKVFKDDESKKAYDIYLATKDIVWDQMEAINSAHISEVDISQYEKWANALTTKLKMKPDEVERYLGAGMKNYHLSIVGGHKKLMLVNCPHPDCNQLYHYDEKNPAKVCPHCGRSLEESCWNCKSAIPISKAGGACPTCGATKAQEALFNKALAAMKAADSSTTATLDDLEKALRALKGCVPGYDKKAGEVSRMVSYYEGTVTARRNEETKSGNAYRAAIAKIDTEKLLKNYMKALSLAEDLKTKFPSYKMKETLALIAEINVEINKAKALTLKAQHEKDANNKNKALEYASNALEICKDYAGARDIIKQVPPDAPVNVRLSIFGSTATVEWRMPADLQQTTYTVIKKIGTPPSNHTDGTELKTGLVINSCEDEDIIPATSYYYAVYAERLGVRSPLVNAVGNVLIYSDVSGVKQNLVDGKISVSWKTPDNIKAIEVWKKDGPVAPAKAGEGTQVTNVTKNGFTDATGTHCSYRIFCLYDVNGKTVYSKGITRTYKRYEMLSPVKDATISARADGNFTISCTPPSVGELSIVYSENRLSASIETLFLRSVFSTECKGSAQTTVSKDINGNLTFGIPANKVVWAYPMVSNEQLFILSSPTLVNTIPGVSNIEFTKSAGSVHIKGDANKAATNVIFKVSEKAFAQNLSDAGDVITIDAASFNSSGATIHLREDSNNYISVLTEFKKNGQSTYTNAIPISNTPIANLRGKKVFYAIEGKPLPTKPFKLKIKFSSSEPVTIPELCIRQGSIRPGSKSVGQYVCKTSPIELKQGFFQKNYTGEITIVVNPCAPSMQFAAFVNDDSITHIALNGTNKL